MNPGRGLTTAGIILLVVGILFDIGNGIAYTQDTVFPLAIFALPLIILGIIFLIVGAVQRRRARRESQRVDH